MSRGDEEPFFTVMNHNDIWKEFKKHMFPGLKTSNFDNYTDGNSAIYNSYYTLLRLKDFVFTEESPEQIFKAKLICYEDDLPDVNVEESTYLNILKFLVNKEVEINSGVLFQAAFHGYLEIVKYLHKLGFVRWDTMDRAIASGNLELVQWLHNNVELNEIDVTQTNLVKCAIENKHIHVVNFLLSIGIKPTTELRDSAISNGSVEILKLIDCKDGYNLISLFGAIEHDDQDIIQYCFETQDLTVYLDHMLDYALSEFHRPSKVIDYLTNLKVQ